MLNVQRMICPLYLGITLPYIGGVRSEYCWTYWFEIVPGNDTTYKVRSVVSELSRSFCMLSGRSIYEILLLLSSLMCSWKQRKENGEKKWSLEIIIKKTQTNRKNNINNKKTDKKPTFPLKRFFFFFCWLIVILYKVSGCYQQINNTGFAVTEL